MRLSRSDKRYIKEQIAALPVSTIAAEIGVTDEEVRKYIKKRWKHTRIRVVSEPLSMPLSRPLTLKQTLPVFILLVFLGFAAYGNSLPNEWVSDDFALVTNRASYSSIQWYIANPFTAIRSLIYGLCFWIGGENPAAFRISTIVFHIGVAYIAYLIVQRVLNKNVALVASLLFVVNPVTVESVVWVSGGTYFQYSFFFLLSLYVYATSRSPLHYFWALVLYVLALFSSEKAVTLVVLFPLYDYISGRLQIAWQRSLPFIGVGTLWFIAYLVFAGSLGNRQAELFSLYANSEGYYNPLMQWPITISTYLGKIFFPKDLSFFYSEVLMSYREYAWHTTILAGYFVALFMAWKKDKRLVFFLSLFIVSLALTLTPLKITHIIAERYVYIGTIGILVVFSYFLDRILIKKHSTIGYSLVAVLVVALSMRTIIRNQDWKNQESLTYATAKTAPSSASNNFSLAELYYQKGDKDKAKETLMKVIKSNSHHAEAYQGLGIIFYEQENDKEAEKYLSHALVLNPLLGRSHEYLSMVYEKTGDLPSAVSHLEKAYSISPTNKSLYNKLGILYLNAGALDKMLKHYERITDDQTKDVKTGE